MYGMKRYNHLMVSSPLTQPRLEDENRNRQSLPAATSTIGLHSSVHTKKMK
jgi:hypothetical protein